MAANQELKEFLVLIFDKPNANRVGSIEQHIAALPAVAGNPMTCGGAVLNKKGDFVGSTLTLRAHDEEEVISFLKKDIFAKEVWDMSSCVIHEVMIAYREGRDI
ncbi:hypothetical protein CAAN1_22S01904 [[Candida] anglica]|uniref:YCII-related domain-containing protein n=1 Tax=[Candida] anglica TaxID=148631 RepID=A0ABP0E9K5_9ASCO